MTQEPKHTSLPWNKYTNHFVRGPLKGCYIVAGNVRIADILAHGGVNSQEECEANAEFIVRACNSHDALVEALSELHAMVKGECPSLLIEDSGGDAELALRIEKALKQAGAA